MPNDCQLARVMVYPDVKNKATEKQISCSNAISRLLHRNTVFKEGITSLAGDGLVRNHGIL